MQVARAELIGFNLADFDTRLDALMALDLQRWLDRALTLRPGYPPAIEALAEVEARAPTLRLYGIKQVQDAVPKLIERDRTLLALAVVRWRANDIPTCLQIVDVIIKSSRATAQVKAAAGALRLRITSETTVVPAKP